MKLNGPILLLAVGAVFLLEFDTGKAQVQSTPQGQQVAQKMPASRRVRPEPEFAPNEVLVKFRSGSSVVAVQAARDRINGQSLGRIERLNVHRFRIAGMSVDQAVEALGGSVAVEWVEPNYLYRPLMVGTPTPVTQAQVLASSAALAGGSPINDAVTPMVTPTDPFFGAYLWGLNNTGQNIAGEFGSADADIDAPEAWNLQTGSPSLIIAVIDTGVNFDHADLAANIWTNSGEIAGNGLDDDHNGFVDDVNGWDFAGNDNNPRDPTSSFSHGTHVAGTIGAVPNNGLGIAGVMWNVKIMPVRFLGTGGSTGYAGAQSILYAVDNGARILSNSWGGGYPSAALADAIDYARSRGVLFVASAGNSSNDVEASYDLFPAAFPHDNIISVAASDNTDGMALFSTWGSQRVDIAAPGTLVLSLGASHAEGYFFASGTSMAAPHVSGVAGLVWSQFSGLDYSQLKERLLASADIDVRNGAFQNKVAANGRLNANRALTGVFGSAVKGDRFGGLHPLGAATIPSGAPYFGFDIARDFELRQLGTGVAAWQLDGLGGLHTINAPTPSSFPPYFGVDVARDVEVLPNGRGGYVLDSHGGIHPWGNAPALPGAPYFGFNIARSLKLLHTTYQSTSAPFSWIDIASAANDTAMAFDDTWVTRAFPFDFPFYGRAYTGVVVSSNGYLSFDAHQNGCGASASIGYCSPYWVEYSGLGDSYPGSDAYGWDAPNNLIAPFAADLVPRSSSKVYSGVVGSAPNRQFVVTWSDMAHYYHSGDSYTFQVILSEANGTIRFQYQTMTTSPGTDSWYGASHVHGAVGIENPTGDAAVFAAWPFLDASTFPGAGTAREVTWVPSAVVLDGYGGVHFIGGAGPRRFPTGPYWPGWDVAEDIVLETRRERGGYKLDAYGGVHFLGSRGLSPTSTYFGFDVAGSILGFGQSGFYVYDRWGGVHTGGDAPQTSGPNPYFGFDVGGKIKSVR